MREKRGPVPIGNIVADILARKGLGRQEATIELDKVWTKIIEKPLAKITEIFHNAFWSQRRPQGTSVGETFTKLILLPWFGLA